MRIGVAEEMPLVCSHPELIGGDAKDKNVDY